jgi:hypothetical protein
VAGPLPVLMVLEITNFPRNFEYNLLEESHTLLRYCSVVLQNVRNGMATSQDLFSFQFGDNELLGRGHTKETDNRNATAISEKCRLFQAGN